MNIDLNTIRKKFNTLFVSKEELHTRPIARPTRDWQIIVIAVAAGILCSALFAGFVYYQVLSDTDAQTQAYTAVSKSKIKSADITGVLDLFETRATLHRSYIQGEGGLADPSR